MFSPFPNMPVGGYMAMRVPKPMEQSSEVDMNEQKKVKVAVALEQAMDNTNVLDMDTYRAQILQQYNQDRVDDKIAYNAWLVAYTAFNDDPSLYRLQRKKEEKKNGDIVTRKTKVNKVYAVFLEDGDYWGNPDSPTKAKAIKRTEMSEASRLSVASSTEPVLVKAWKPRIVTEGFEHLGRPPTFSQLFFSSKFGRHYDESIVDIDTSGTGVMVNDEQEMLTMSERLEAHIMVGNDMEFYQRLSNRAKMLSTSSLFTQFEKDKGLFSPQLSIRGRWKTFSGNMRFLSHDLATAEAIKEYHQSSPLSQKKSESFSDEVILNGEYIEKSNYLLDEISFLKGLRENAIAKFKNNLYMQLIKYYQTCYPCAYHAFKSLGVREKKHVWHSFRHNRWFMSQPENLVNYGTPITQQYQDQSFTYAKWLRGHHVHNLKRLAQRPVDDYHLSQVSFNRGIKSRLFFESLPDVSYIIESYINKRYYYSLSDKDRYDHYWNYVVDHADHDDTMYQKWLIDHCDPRNQVVDIVQDTKQVVAPKTPMREVARSNGLLAFVDDDFINKDFDRDRKTGLLLPKITSYDMERDSSSGLMIPIGSSASDRIRAPLKPRSWLDKAKEFFTNK